ncbi:MAG: hypothetical protein ACJ0BI_00160 [Paracoccaceae bacterium]
MNKQNENFNDFEKLDLREIINSKVSSELRSSGLDDQKSKNVVNALVTLLKSEKEVLMQMASSTHKNADEFLKEYTYSDIGAKNFREHEELVTSVYGQQVNFMEMAIDENTVDKLAAHLDTLNSVKFTDFCELKQTTEQPDPLHKIIFEKEKSAVLDKNMTLLDYKNSEMNKRLLSGLRKEISKYVKSPFVFVNTRAWITKPGAERFGPNDEHLDGFNAGHMKIMIYLTPMNVEFGYFTINGQKVIDRKPGATILFRNSNLRHSGIPGNKFPRICMEITLQRTLLNSTQTHNGHPIGGHNYCITSAYNGGTLEL